jgi:hypothetical protein
MQEINRTVGEVDKREDWSGTSGKLRMFSGLFYFVDRSGDTE